MSANPTADMAQMLVQTLLEEPNPSAEEITKVVLEEAADAIRCLASEYEKEVGICRLSALGLREAADWITEEREEIDA